MNHIGHRDKGEIQRVGFSCRRIQRRRTSGTFAAADDVGANDKVPVGIKGLAGPDHVIPPARIILPLVNACRVSIAGKGMHARIALDLSLFNFPYVS